jgi:hypothetical protein
VIDRVFVYQAMHGFPVQIYRWVRRIGLEHASWPPFGYRLVGILNIRWKTPNDRP